jgi:putative Holliday junction resolvase
MKPASNTNNHVSLIALDVGDKRIGVAHADTSVRLPIAYTTIEVDELVLDRLREVVAELEPTVIVVGLPRNQQGRPTHQTRKVRDFAARLEHFDIAIAFQDESLTSVLAEKYLQSLKKTYTKADIDSHAAAIILGDYLESHFGA